MLSFRRIWRATIAETSVLKRSERVSGRRGGRMMNVMNEMNDGED